MDGTKIKAWRRARRLSQREAAVLLGVGRVTVSRWECGVQDPPAGLVTLALAELERRLEEEGERNRVALS